MCVNKRMQDNGGHSDRGQVLSALALSALLGVGKATAQDSAQTSPPLWRGPGLLLPELAAPLQAGHSYPFPSTYGVGLCNTGPSPRVPQGVMSIFVSLQHLVSCRAQNVQTALRVLAVPLTALPVPGLCPLPSSPQMILAPSQNSDNLPNCESLITSRINVYRVLATSPSLPDQSFLTVLILNYPPHPKSHTGLFAAPPKHPAVPCL